MTLYLGIGGGGGLKETTAKLQQLGTEEPDVRTAPTNDTGAMTSTAFR